MSIKKAVIIVAGGKGSRMETEIPKQFLLVQGKPILMHTIENFYHFDPKIKIVVVIPLNDIVYWEQLCQHYHFKIKHLRVFGGSSRFASVTNGLKAIKGAAHIAVHDGVRPFVSHQTIERCFREAEISGTAIAVIDCVDSIREVDENGSSSVDRSLYKLVQTPQVFNAKLLRDAYKQPFSALFTDDASVVESYFASKKKYSQNQISLVEGNRENIKITTQFDLKIAEAFLKNDN